MRKWCCKMTWQHAEKRLNRKKIILNNDRKLALWKQSWDIHPSSVPSPPLPSCCFPFPPVSEFCWFVGFGPDRLKALAGSTQPREDWITPSIGVSCQMVSCTCCLKQGGPVDATAQQTLKHIITVSKMIMLFTHAHTHNRWLFHTHSALCPDSLWRRFTQWRGNGWSQPAFKPSNQHVWCQ